MVPAGAAVGVVGGLLLLSWAAAVLTCALGARANGRGTLQRRAAAAAAPASRWVVLAAATVAECTGCGIGYSFGVYSPTLKANFGLEQTQVDAISGVSMVISLPPFCFGFAWLYDRFGPRLSQKVGWVGSVALSLQK
jgi:hypothetical protein